MVSRRAFCVLTGAAIVASGRGSAADVDGSDRLDAWLRLVRNHEAAARIGARLQPKLDRSARASCATSLSRLSGHTGETSPELLHRMIADEFRTGQTLLLDGVLFSRTEVLLYDRAYRRSPG